MDEKVAENYKTALSATLDVVLAEKARADQAEADRNRLAEACKQALSLVDSASGYTEGSEQLLREARMVLRAAAKGAR
jgi:hypothetical protein